MTKKLFALMLGLLFLSCARTPDKKYYTLNYEPEALPSRHSPAPWPCTLRIKNFAVEAAYARPQVVYRKNPYELEYYFYRVWAVKPDVMMSDLVRKHLLALNLVKQVVLRYDEGEKPAYELQGSLESIEEYDSENTWFAHLDFSVRLVRTRDGAVIYTRDFDTRRQVQQREPEYVIMVLSQLADYSISSLAADLDGVFEKEYQSPQAAPADTTTPKQK